MIDFETPEQIARRKEAGERLLAAKAQTPKLDVAVAELRRRTWEELEQR